MKRLEEKVSIRGTGIKGLTATLVKREGNVAMYLRSDGYYETGVVLEQAGGVMPNGSIIEAGEKYWGNEEFGTDAKTTFSRKVADIHFIYFQRRENLKISTNNE